MKYRQGIHSNGLWDTFWWYHSKPILHIEILWFCQVLNLYLSSFYPFCWLSSWLFYAFCWFCLFCPCLSPQPRIQIVFEHGLAQSMSERRSMERRSGTRSTVLERGIGTTRIFWNWNANGMAFQFWAERTAFRLRSSSVPFHGKKINFPHTFW